MASDDQLHVDIGNAISDHYARGTQFSSKDFEGMSDKEHSIVLHHSGRLQRGEPESAMLRIQNKLGGGVYSHAVEHTGDLYWRTHAQRHVGMSDHAEVGNKVDKVLRGLTSPYGFEREMKENLKGNSAYKKDPSINWESAVLLGKDYASAHDRLPAYNQPASMMAQATRHLGSMRFGATTETLSQLKGLHDNESHWDALHSRQGTIDFLKSQGR